MQICAYFEEIAYDSPNFKVITCSTNDESAAKVPQRRAFAKKEKYVFNVVFRSQQIELNFDKSKQYIFYGEWKTRSFGISFEAYTYEINVQKNKKDIVEYLSKFDGIGKKTAEAVYDEFGGRTLEILKDQPEKINSLKLKKDKINKLINGLKANRCFRETMEFFLQFSLPVNRVGAIYERYKEDAIKTMQINPFELSESGYLSFPEANAAAIKQGIELNSGNRLEQALLYVMKTYFRQSGDLFFKVSDVIEITLKCLNRGVADKEQITETVLKKRLKGLNNIKVRIFGDFNYVYLIEDLFAEKKTAELLVDFLDYENNSFKLDKKECYKEISEIEKEIGFELNEAQKEAVYTAICSNVSIITGGPGTGKTTLLRFLIRIFQRNFSNNIKLCSPTGKAARRMAESTGIESASTIHSLLGLTSDYKWSPGIKSIEEISADLLVVDEASMLDMELMYLLISNIPFTCKLVFLGDVDQLPSVGPGNVLYEMINSGVIPTTVLDKIYRQAEQSNIVKNSYHLNKGEYKELVFDKGKSVSDSFVLVPRKQDIDTQLADIFCNSVKKSGSIEDVQILSPYRKEGRIASTSNINKIIQKKINPYISGMNEIKYSDKVFRIKDRVIQQKNTKDAKNGDIGEIVDIGLVNNRPVTAVIDFGDGNTVTYGVDEMIENGIELAYALTVHKSQGSEYKTVIMPCIPEHENMLTKKLVYTAWTRAKEHIIVVGDEKTIDKVAVKTEAKKRNTVLADRIKKEKNKRG